MVEREAGVLNLIFTGCANRWKKRPVSTSVNVAAWRLKKSIDHVGRRPGFPNPVFVLRYHAGESDVRQRISQFSRKRNHCQRGLATSLRGGLFSFKRPPCRIFCIMALVSVVDTVATFSQTNIDKLVS